jgi:hypothetical protein
MQTEREGERKLNRSGASQLQNAFPCRHVLRAPAAAQAAPLSVRSDLAHFPYIPTQRRLSNKHTRVRHRSLAHSHLISVDACKRFGNGAAAVRYALMRPKFSPMFY